jgi:serine/threonine-protein kinase HipA
MSRLDVFLDGRVAGALEHSPDMNRFAFGYADAWLNDPQHYALSPHLPIPPADIPPEVRNVKVRNFFENLLPEGHALDDAAAANKISKSNLFGLIAAMGRETAGALSLRLPDEDREDQQNQQKALQTEDTPMQRHLSQAELSNRIRARPYQPFSVWDGKVRLSIAGYQDKVAVFRADGEWYLVDSGDLASTTILKPEPLIRNLAGLTSNEFFCMRLARRIGLPVADVRLRHVPDPVLEVDRFDRVVAGAAVRRRHIIDGCQLLGIPPAMKYERPYGDNPAVANIRDGASLPRLFETLSSSFNPAAQRLQLLRWAIARILMGDTDAHAKNLSFFYDQDGMRIAPHYDLVSILAFADEKIEDSYAMAIGDAFREKDFTAFEWANFAHGCKLRPQLIARELARMSVAMMKEMQGVRHEVLAEGADAAVVDKICGTVARLAEAHIRIAPHIPQVDVGALQ